MPREYISTELNYATKLHEIIESKLGRDNQSLPEEVYLKKKNQDEGERVTQKVEEKAQTIHLLAEQLLNSYQTGVEADEEYLEDVAEMAIDYYRKDWHELVDESHMIAKKERWSTSKEQRMKEAIQRLHERKKNK